MICLQCWIGPNFIALWQRNGMSCFGMAQSAAIHTRLMAMNLAHGFMVKRRLDLPHKRADYSFVLVIGLSAVAASDLQVCQWR